jgi:hypothetical protein
VAQGGLIHAGGPVAAPGERDGEFLYEALCRSGHQGGTCLHAPGVRSGRVPGKGAFHSPEPYGGR